MLLFFGQNMAAPHACRLLLLFPDAQILAASHTHNQQVYTQQIANRHGPMTNAQC